MLSTKALKLDSVICSNENSKSYCGLAAFENLRKKFALNIAQFWACGKSRKITPVTDMHEDVKAYEASVSCTIQPAMPWPMKMYRRYRFESQ